MAGMFSMDTFLQDGYVAITIGWRRAVHIIGTLAASKWTLHTLWLDRIRNLPDFGLELLLDDRISPVSLCHLSASSSQPSLRSNTAN
jgi:hypothetical protein